MARARRKQRVQVDAGEGKPIVRDVPAVCPVCGQTFVKGNLDTRAEMPRHLEGHAPAEPCPNCGTQHVGWKIDWDLVKYPRPDVSIFYCSPCGIYAKEIHP
jgi:hypothetical protein